MIGVYAIICLANRKLYVGQSVNIRRRFRSHKYKLRKNEHDNQFLQKAWSKYGEKMFAFVILELTSKKKVLEKEQWWITELKSYDGKRGFNKNKFK